MDRFSFTNHYFRYRYAMSTATRSSNKHPSSLVALVNVDGPVGDGEGYRRLSCYGALEVEIVDGDPVFTARHVSTTDNDDRRRLFCDIGSLSHERHVVVGSCEANEDFRDRRHILEAGLVYLDIIDGLKTIQPANLNLMGAPEEAMIQLASTFGLRNCYQTDVLSQARAAGVRAQILWLAYVAATLGRKETRKLFAAFQAWQALEMARPIPF